MKKNIPFFILFILSITVYCHNQYYVSDGVYIEGGRIFSGILNFKGEFNPDNYHYDWTNSTSYLLKPIEKLNITISLECDKYLHFYVIDASEKRWEHPSSISESYKQKLKSCPSTKTLKDFGLFINEEMDQPFYLKLIEPNSGELIFTTENTDFLYTDVFISFAGMVSTNDVYGFGERYHELKLGDGKFTMWPNDTTGIHEDTGEGGYNAMGIHPLGFHRTSKNVFVGLLFNNINAQDLVIKSNYTKGNNHVLLEHRTIGGVIDYYLTLNDTPEKALISIHDIIGHPTLPPYWSLGFHQCRWGYKSDKDIRYIYGNYTKYELPIDTFWGDIDILENFRIFTLNQNHFKGLPDLINELHEKNYHFVPIVDIGFPMKDIDEFYIKGKETNAFIKSNYTKQDLVSFVWPGYAVFPDFFSKAGEDLWKYGMEKYYEILKYDGIWLDMNEPTMIMVNDIKRGEILPSSNYTFDPDNNYYEYIPYVPGYRDDHPTIRGRTLSENCYSNSINENKFLYGYNFKPMMSYLQNINTNKNIVSILNKRPFILSRSTSLSHGRYAFHWLGDNYSTYKDMRNGLNGIFQFQIYGIPMTGDDICGFNSKSWDELCARWMSMGAFFPFSRNHNINTMPAQEPYAFGENSKTFNSSKLSLRMRYSLIRYYYTELFKVSLGEKGSFFKPVFFEYYLDEKTMEIMDESFMLGDTFLIYPIFKDETDDIEVYMPIDDWSKFPSGDVYKNKRDWYGGKIKLSGEFGQLHIFMRGGKIFPYQNTFDKYVQNTKALNGEKTELYIIPDSVNHVASGDIIFDNDDYDTIATKNYYYININFSDKTLSFNTNNSMTSSYDNQDIYISKLKFFRMKYLKDQLKGNKVKITYKTESKIINFEILNDDIFEVNLSEFNIKFYEINEVNFEVDEGDSSDSTDKESCDTDEHSNGNNYLSMSVIVYFLYLLL